MTHAERLKFLKPSARRILELLSDGMFHTSQQIQEVVHILEYRSRLTEIRNVMSVEIKSEDANINGHWHPGYRLVRHEVPADLFQGEQVSR
jgi:hypothetical protein